MISRIMCVVCLLMFCGQVTAKDKPTFRLMTAKRDAFYRDMLPKVNDDRLHKMFKDPTLLLYTDYELPKVHQDWEGALQGLFDPRYNVSANRAEPYGNGNIEFPWGAPAGTHRCNNVKTVRFLYLPRDDKGKLLPVVYYQGDRYYYGRRFVRGINIGRDDSRNQPGWHWLFPKGTVVGEMLMMRDHDGYLHTFEIRTRTRQADRWVVNAYRPFPTADSLVKAVQARSDWQDSKQLVALVKHLQRPLRGDVYQVSDLQPDKAVFRGSAREDVLPPISYRETTSLLAKTEFTSALGATWRGDGRYAPHAPTTNTNFHIVPRGYMAGYIDVTSKSCMQCHASTNQSVSEFHLGRDWYGRIRGSDGIFSFHPFEPDIISRHTPFVRFNQAMLGAGVIAQLNPKVHPTAYYRRIKGLQ